MATKSLNFRWVGLLWRMTIFPQNGTSSALSWRDWRHCLRTVYMFKLQKPTKINATIVINHCGNKYGFTYWNKWRNSNFYVFLMWSTARLPGVVIPPPTGSAKRLLDGSADTDTWDPKPQGRNQLRCQTWTKIFDILLFLFTCTFMIFHAGYLAS